MFSENVQTHSMSHSLRTDCTGATVEFQNKGLGFPQIERIQFTFSVCEEY